VVFVRMLQLCRLRRAERDELAIEVVMFGQEALVLRRQITRPALRPADRAVFAGSSRLMSKVRRGGSSFSPRRCSAGIETMFGPVHHHRPDLLPARLAPPLVVVEVGQRRLDESHSVPLFSGGRASVTNMCETGVTTAEG
jgi:hypothetical protein